jgi:3-oxoacyl-[acyl-carrier protein] reductase
MDLGLSGKKAVITGASRGLGYAIAQGLVSEGANLVINSRDSEMLSTAAAKLRTHGAGQVYSFAGDVSRPDFANVLINESANLLGGIDLLVTNSGGPKTGKFESMSDEDWMDAINLVYLSHIRLIRAALPFLRKSNTPSVLTITSISAKQPIPDLILSNSLRAGVLGLTKSLSQELGGEGIRFNSILPGWTKTDRSLSLIQDRSIKNKTTPEIEMQKQSESTALKRIATPEEFANAAVFLLSPAASYLTGVMLPVDGGSYKALL